MYLQNICMVNNYYQSLPEMYYNNNNNDQYLFMKAKQTKLYKLLPLKCSHKKKKQAKN